MPIHKQEHLQITALFADFIVPNLVICCWSKSLQEWGTHNFSSSFWQKKILKEFQFCAHFFCAIIIYLRIICSFFLFYFFRFFFLSTFFSSRNSRTRQINRDHYGSTPYHSSHVRLEKKVDIRWVGKMAWKELFWGSCYRIPSCPLGDSAKLKTSDCVVILSKITSCQSKGY